MSLKKKLGLYNFGGASLPEAEAPQAQAMQKPVPQRGAATSGEDRRRELFGLEFEEIAPAACVRRVVVRPGESLARAGNCALDQYLPLRLSSIVELTLTPDPEALHPEDVLFLDTETTGLNRGAGNLPFLIGLAYFRGESIVLEQLYLENPGGEESFLEYLLALFRRFRFLTSYNGRSFDVPLIKNRLVLNRRSALPGLTHFDLLHVFRRLYPKGAIPAYKQQELEREMLGRARVDDLPGAEIPQVYFDYVKYGHDAGMARIFEHNLHDLLGMVFLFLEAVRVYDQRGADRGAALRSGLARILLRNRREDEALELLEALQAEAEGASDGAGRDVAAATAPGEGDDPRGSLRYRDLLLLGQLYRQRGAFEKSASLFARVADEYDCVFARMNLAKLCEHRLRDFPAALAHTGILLQKWDAAESLPAERIYSRNELERRRQRIEAKQTRAAQPGRGQNA